jgi:nucleoside-diphosphate-sugar epimerase
LKIFLAGASGVLGMCLVLLLLHRGHHVIGTSRTQKSQQRIRTAGAEPILLDPFDRAAIEEAVCMAKPDVVVHQMTALAGVRNYKHVDREFALTNRRRTEGTENLLAAGTIEIFIAPVSISMMATPFLATAMQKTHSRGEGLLALQSKFLACDLPCLWRFRVIE